MCGSPFPSRNSCNLVTILGNRANLFVIRSESLLHTPLFYFLSVLATSALRLSLSSLPITLQIFVFKATGISPKCLLCSRSPQCSCSCVSFDHFLAIHNTLRHSFIPTSARVDKVGLVFLNKSMLLVLLFPFTLNRLECCKKNLLSHPFCSHQNVRS